MDWLTSLPTGVLVVGCLLLTVSVGMAARIGVRRLVPVAEHDHVPQIAAPLMAALGAAFGILMGLTVASEAGYLKSAQEIVAGEAAAASRLAWASTSPDVQSEPIQTALRDYLEATRDAEWHDDGAARSSSRVVASLANLERTVRIEASRADLTTPQATELLTALDSLTSGRRSRIDAASRQIPLVYVITLMVSGLALIVNAGALGVRSSARAASLVLGLAIVVGLSFALMFSLTAPWRGGLTISTEPIDSMIADLRAEIFQ